MPRNQHGPTKIKERPLVLFRDLDALQRSSMDLEDPPLTINDQGRGDRKLAKIHQGVEDSNTPVFSTRDSIASKGDSRSIQSRSCTRLTTGRIDGDGNDRRIGSVV